MIGNLNLEELIGSKSALRLLIVMHMNKTRLLIWGVASVTAGTALYVLLPTHWKHWWHMLQLWIQEGNPFKNFPFWILPAGIVFDFILIFKLITSYGMFKLQSWGRTLAIYVLSADFLLRLAGFINVQTYYWRHPEMIQRYNEMKSMASPGHFTITISYIPSYIIGLLSLISVIILIIRSVKKRFRRIAGEVHKSESAYQKHQPDAD